MACAQLGPLANFKPAISASQLLPVGCSTSGPARATWISKNALPVCKSGRLMYRGAECNRKRACSFIFNVRRWIELRLLHCRKLSTITRHKPGLKIRSEAPSPHIPDTSSKTNGETVNAITGNLGSAATLTTLEVPNVVDANSSTSIAGETLWSQSDNTKLAPNPFLSIVVVGATGELAKSKIFPALFALYYGGRLPKNFAIFGYSRSKLTDAALRESISERLACRIDGQENCGEKTQIFLEKVFYQCGGYESCENLRRLDGRLVQLEGAGVANRIFYLSVPQDVLLVVASCLSASAKSQKGWTRLIVEKPFGNDAASSAQITKALLSGFEEEQIYRIDHLLGKEIIENLTVLRFANLVFEPLWCRTYIRNVQFVYSEDWGVTEGKGRYFDEQGVIRDLVQSHLLPTIALFAMEPPVSLDGNDIRNEKVKVLRSMRKPTFPHDVVLGQYKASISKDGKSKIRGYLDEPDVNPNSITPTFVATILYIDNARWDGVPFLVKAGKGLIKHTVEIRIQFRHVPGNLYGELFGYNVESSMNELILRVQPDAGLFLKINNKVPGLGTQLDTTELNLLYREKYDDEIPDSYERLILDVIDGENHLFIRGDELEATWDLLSPLLEQIQTLKVAPELYTFGGRGPVGAYYLGANHGVKWADD